MQHDPKAKAFGLFAARSDINNVHMNDVHYDTSRFPADIGVCLISSKGRQPRTS